MSNSEENFMFPKDQPSKTRIIMESAKKLAHVGADFEVLFDQLQYADKFTEAIQKLVLKIQQKFQNAYYETYQTPFENAETGEYRTFTLPMNLPEAIGKSFSLNYYWFNMSNAPQLQQLTQDLDELYQKTLHATNHATTVEVINLHDATKSLYSNLVNNNLAKDWVIIENLQSVDAETFWLQYQERYQNHREIAYLYQSNREKQYNIDHMRITIEKIHRQKEDCLTGKSIANWNLQICETDLENNITQFKSNFTEKETELNSINQKLKEVELKKEGIEKDLKQTKNSIKEIQKSNSLTIAEKNNLIKLKKEEILSKDKILTSLTNQNTELELGYRDISNDLDNLIKKNVKIEQEYKQCLTKNSEILTKKENCLTPQPGASIEEQFQKLKESWDENIVRKRQEAEEFKCQKKFLEFRETYQQELKQTIQNVTENCARDATNSFLVNEELAKEIKQCQQELIRCEIKNAPKLPVSESESITNISNLSNFGQALTHIFAWAVTFLIWPISLHNPESELWKILGKIAGMEIKKGPTGIVRGWTCEFLAVFISILWWLFLMAVGRKVLWQNEQIKNKNIKNQEFQQFSHKITKWEKLKQKLGKGWKNISKLLDLVDNINEDEKTSKVIYVSRGGAVVTPILEYHDFLLFVTIHTLKIANYNVNQRTSLDFELLKLNKNQSKLKLICDKFINILGPIALVLAITTAQLPNNLNNLNNFKVTPEIEISNNSTMSLELYSNKFQKQVESNAMSFAKAELEVESKIETQIEKPKTKNKFWRKKLKQLAKKKTKSHFSGRNLKKIKQVKKLSDLPVLETFKNSDIIEEQFTQTYSRTPVKVANN